MSNEEHFFEQLKTYRESKKIEISEICDFTKINAKYIEAIENGDFNALPVVYMRLFLRSYANFIGADPSKALEDFELYTTGKIQNKLTSAPNTKEKNNNTFFHNSQNIISNQQIAPKQVAIGAIVIIGLFLILYWAGRVTNQQNRINLQNMENTIKTDSLITNSHYTPLKKDTLETTESQKKKQQINQ